jgi:KDO2-lipid IV(A) lauroyltransferase
MMAREWREWRRIVEPPTENLARVTRVVGQERFDAALSQGKGVILLLHHSQFSRLALAWLRDRGYETATVGMPNQDLEKRGFQTPAQKSFELGRQMHAAKHRLGKGGIVVNVPDAYQNLESFRMVEFFGRLRPIATGFAELALKSGARVLPIAYRLSTGGLFELEFAAPLEIQAQDVKHDSRVDALVRQYAEFLRAEWRPYPWDLHWHHLDFFSQLPPLHGGAVRTVPNRRR